jgi:glucose/mannose-6-phosphate isomerase
MVSVRPELSSTLAKLDRYRTYWTKDFPNSLTKFQEYELNDEAKRLIGKRFKRIVFTGMGCSAIVSFMVRGFLVSQGSDIEFDIVNDYDPTYTLGRSLYNNSETLIVISSYSGHSAEPIKAYREFFKQSRGQILFLTAGGKLGEIGEADKMPIAYWRLSASDREYPLFHAPQFFAILLEIFRELGITGSNFQDELSTTQERVRQYVGSDAVLAETAAAATKMRNRDLTLIAAPKWTVSLMRLAQMHLNEIANHPTHIAPFHDYCHSEVAILNDPRAAHGLLLFRDPDEDEYTMNKMDNFVRLITDDHVGNNAINLKQLLLNGSSFTEQMFLGLAWIQCVTDHLGQFNLMGSRELISRAAGNAWYNSRTISNEISENRRPMVLV